MGCLQFCMVSAKGNRLDELPRIFEEEGYADCDTSTVETADAAVVELGWNPSSSEVAKIAFIVGGSTYVFDDEAVLGFGDDLRNYTRESNSRIIAWTCGTKTGDYMFKIFDSGKMLTGCISPKGMIKIEDTGKRIPQHAHFPLGSRNPGSMGGDSFRMPLE